MENTKEQNVDISSPLLMDKEAVLDFCICNAFKYLFRWKNKNGVEDITKANWYLNKYLELV